MIAARLHQFGAGLVVEEVPEPSPQPGEVVVAVRACGVNRVDAELVEGHYGGVPIASMPFGREISKLLPNILGIEAAGIVSAVGEGVSRNIIGERVLVHSALTCGSCRFCKSGRDNYCPEIRTVGIQSRGGYAERCLAPARNLIPLPDAVTFEYAAAIETQFGTAWEMIHTMAKTGPTDVVLVAGATGGVGHACVQIASLLGATVIAVGGSRSKLNLIQQMGAHHVIDTSETPDFSEIVLDLTSGLGASVVAEVVGAATWSQSLASAGRAARIVVGGAHAGARVELDLGRLFGNGLEIYGITRAPRFAMEDCVRMVHEGKLKPFISQTIDLANINDAFAAITARSHVGKIVISVEAGIYAS